MLSAVYEEFHELLEDLKTQKENIQKQIDDNNLQIIEAKSYAKEILNREEEDFKVFSPRKLEDIYKDELEKSNAKQVNCEDQNQRLIVKKDELDSIISVLEKVALELNKSSVSEVEEYETSEICEEVNSENDIAEDTYSVQKATMEDNEKNSINEVINRTVQNLNSIQHKVDLSIKFIQQDPMRTKMELEVVSKSITRVSKKLSSITGEEI